MLSIAVAISSTSPAFLLYVHSRQLILAKSLPANDSMCSDMSLGNVPIVPIQHRGSMISAIGFDYTKSVIYYTTADAVWRRDASSDSSQADLGNIVALLYVRWLF